MMRKTMTVLTLGLALAAGTAGADGHGKGILLGADEMDWNPARPGSPLSVVVLWGKPGEGAHGRLLKLPAGFKAPVHAHTGDYNGINLTGTWRHYFDNGESKDLPPGSHVLQPGGQMHGDECIGTEDCIQFLQQSVKAHFIPKKK